MYNSNYKIWSAGKLSQMETCQGMPDFDSSLISFIMQDEPLLFDLVNLNKQTINANASWNKVVAAFKNAQLVPAFA